MKKWRIIFLTGLFYLYKRITLLLLSPNIYKGIQMELEGKREERGGEYKPRIFSASENEDVRHLKDILALPGIIVIDTIENQLTELIKIDHPGINLAMSDMEIYLRAYLGDLTLEQYGNWVYYPWRNTVVHLLGEAEFVRLRTSRNQFKITPEEQAVIGQKKVGVIGLSVGQSVAISLAMERCFGELRIADFDHLDLSNLNRIRTGIFNLGLPKTCIVAREVAEIDPYLKITIYNEGVNEQNMRDFFTLGGHLDVLIEECDNLSIKLGSRIMAKDLGIPVLMDTSDRGMIDIERFDKERDRPIFHGLLREFGAESGLVSLLPEHGREVMASLLDFEKLSERARYSFSQIGKSINTWPQLASSVLLGGAACCHICRMILLNQNVTSGRYYIDLDSLFSSHEG